jgi:hypothetical protein
MGPVDVGAMKRLLLDVKSESDGVDTERSSKVGARTGDGEVIDTGRG